MSEPEKHIKFPVIQVIGGFMFVVLVGFLIVAFSGKSDKDKEQANVLFQGHQLTQYATKICSKAINKKGGDHILSPNETKGDRINSVTLLWHTSELSKASFKEASCTYEKIKGIISLVIDGKETIDTP